MCVSATGRLVRIEGKMNSAEKNEEFSDFSKMLQFKQNMVEAKWSEYFLNVVLLYTNVIYRECLAILST